MTIPCPRCLTPGAVLVEDAGMQCMACDARDAEDYAYSLLDLDAPACVEGDPDCEICI